MDKKIVDGMVAILYSPGFGAGWYTWNRDYPGIVFDSRIVEMVEQKRLDSDKIEEWYGGKLYQGGLSDLKIMWIPKGVNFRINEYHGAESIEIITDNSLLVA